MTEADIIEIFITAAEVDARLPQTAKPKALKAIDHGYFHTAEDVRGWGGERFEQERADFFDAKSTRLTRNDIGLYEVSMELIKLVRKPENRRALWAWASSKAGGMSIAKWAKTVEHVSSETVSRRAKASITEIHHKLECNGELHNQNDIDQVLPSTPEISDKTTTIRAWRDEDARPVALAFDTDIAGLDWAELQKAKRRERDARRRQAA
jgi:hypothetical protein